MCVVGASKDCVVPHQPGLYKVWLRLAICEVSTVWRTPVRPLTRTAPPPPSPLRLPSFPPQELRQLEVLSLPGSVVRDEDFPVGPVGGRERGAVATARGVRTVVCQNKGSEGAARCLKLNFVSLCAAPTKAV